MKKFFSSEKGKRLLIGLGLVALALILGFLLQGVLLESGVRWKQAIFFLVVTGTGIGGLLYIFFDRKGLLIGYGVFFYISLIILLSGTVTGIVGVLFALPIIVGPALLNYFAKKKSTRIVGKPHKSARNEPNSITRPAWLQMQSEHAPLLVAKRASGTIYQVFLHNENLLFYKVGTFFRDLDEHNLKQPDNLPELGKDDFLVAIKDVTALRFHEIYSDDDPFDLGINIYSKQKRHFLLTIKENGGTQVANLLRECIPQKLQQQKNSKPHFIPSLNRRKRGMMRKVYFVVCAFALFVGLAFSFMRVPYRLFAWFALFPTPIFLLMHILYPNEVTLAEDKRFAHGRVMVFYALLLSAMPLMIRSFSDFNIQSYGKLLAYSGILLVILVTLTYKTSEECRIRKGQLVGLALILGVYCVSSVCMLNALLDFSPAQEQPALVQEMTISRGKNLDTYYLDVMTPDKRSHHFRVAEYLFDETQVGGTVNILSYQGAFGIPFIQVEETP